MRASYRAAQFTNLLALTCHRCGSISWMLWSQMTGERGVRGGTGCQSKPSVARALRRRGGATRVWHLSLRRLVRARAASEGEINGVCRGCFTLLARGVQRLTYPKGNLRCSSMNMPPSSTGGMHSEPAVWAGGNAAMAMVRWKFLFPVILELGCKQYFC